MRDIKTMADLQYDDLTLCRAYADSHDDFDSRFLYKLELGFRERGQLTAREWKILQDMMQKYDVNAWEVMGNR